MKRIFFIGSGWCVCCASYYHHGAVMIELNPGWATTAALSARHRSSVVGRRRRIDDRRLAEERRVSCVGLCRPRYRRRTQHATTVTRRRLSRSRHLPSRGNRVESILWRHSEADGGVGRGCRAMESALNPVVSLSFSLLGLCS